MFYLIESHEKGNSAELVQILECLSGRDAESLTESSDTSIGVLSILVIV